MKHNTGENMVNLFTLFSGIGAPEQGAFRVYGKENVNVVGACEYDKFARQSYEANYDIEPEHFHKDVNDLDATQYRGKVDILIGGSPCQSFSLAGLRKGTEDHRGELIYEYIRVVDECRPEIIIYENVKGIMSTDNGNTIKDFVQALRDIGYHCHYGVVNTKDYGVPQNRERLYLVGFLDSDLYHKFQFADKQPLTKRLKDVLEDDVDEKYYLNRELNMTYESQANTIHDPEKVSPTLCAFTHGYAGGYIYQTPRGLNPGGAVAVDGVCPTISSSAWEHNNHYIEPSISVDEKYYLSDKTLKGFSAHKDRHTKDNTLKVPSATKQGYETVTEPMICASRGRNPDNPSDRTAGKHVEQRIEVNTNGTSNALTSVQKDNYVIEPTHRIRKLTERECLRLQDFPDTFKISVSSSQMYKQIGNSMSVNILEMIFNQIERARGNECRDSLLGFMGA